MNYSPLPVNVRGLFGVIGITANFLIVLQCCA